MFGQERNTKFKDPLTNPYPRLLPVCLSVITTALKKTEAKNEYDVECQVKAQKINKAK